MSRTIAPAALAALALGTAVAPAAAQAPAPGTITASGVGVARVNQQVERTQTAIAAAVERARDRAVPAAVSRAGGQARRIAAATGLTLGAVVAVAEPGTPFGFFGPDGTFGPGRYCGTVPRFRTVVRDGRRRRVRVGARRTCRVPREVVTSLSVTYALQ
jgi:uncharacterized protein YggE